jgi:uncharacterized membrane protein
MKPKRSGAGSRSRKAPGVARIEAPLPAARIDVVDAARGVAITMMIAYHFCFDLTYYRWADWAMLDDLRWIAWRSAIVTAFLFVSGLSLALRDDRERRSGTSAWSDRGFLRRWAQIAGAALLVTAGSAMLFPASFIYFGVLHFVAVAIWVCRRAPRLGGSAIALGIGAIALGLSVADPAFDPRWIDWIGFAADKPITEDYVPLFPWVGVVLVGCGVGALWARRGFSMSSPFSAAWQAVPRAIRVTLATMGRWSLTIYLLHQPLLLGAMGAMKQLA